MEQLETRQLLTAYYIDPVGGSDANIGSFDKPFRTVQNLTSWAANEGLANYHPLVAGDTVYLREGVHDWSALLTPNPNRVGAAFLLRDIHGTETSPITIQAFPGEHAIVKGQVAGIENMPIYILQSSHVKILGLEITGTYGGGIWVAEATDVEIANNYIHDVDGYQNNNLAGIHTLSVVGLHIHHNLLHDNYDQSAVQQGRVSENSRNIVIFADGSDRVEIDHNKVFNTPPAGGQQTGGGIWVKHASVIPNASFEIHDNIVHDVSFSAIGGQTPNLHMDHNLIVDGAPFLVTGGANFIFPGLVLGHNTWVGSPAINLYGVEGNIPTSGFLDFRNNVVVDNASLYNIDRGIIRLAPYGSDADYRTAVAPQNLVFDQNVYFNPGASSAPRWNIFSANGGEFGVLGGLLDFADWQALGTSWPQGLDRHSLVADPQLDASYMPTNPAAADAGWLSSDEPRLTMYVGQDLFLESAGTNASSVTLVRAGMDLSQPLTVTLSTSDATEIQLPASVTFAAGVAVLHVPIAAINDHREEPTRAVQLFASTNTNLRASEWVRVLQDPGAIEPDGVNYAYYEGNWDRLPNFAQLAPVKTGTTATFTLAPMRDYQFGFRFQTLLTISVTGDYVFYLGSDDGSRLMIGNTVVVDNDGLHPYVVQPGAIYLDAGPHPLTVDFFESGGLEQLTVEYAGPGLLRETIPATALSQPGNRPWQNPANPCDVNADGLVTPLDALLIIRELNRAGSHPLDVVPNPAVMFPYWDVLADGSVTPLDVLQVISFLDHAAISPTGEGEASAVLVESYAQTTQVTARRERTDNVVLVDTLQAARRSANRRSGVWTERDWSLENVLDELAADSPNAGLVP